MQNSIICQNKHDTLHFYPTESKSTTNTICYPRQKVLPLEHIYTSTQVLCPHKTVLLAHKTVLLAHKTVLFNDKTVLSLFSRYNCSYIGENSKHLTENLVFQSRV